MGGNGHKNGNAAFSRYVASGLLATVAWFLLLIVYGTFRAFGIEDPALQQVFLLLTGAWVGNLTLAQGKKTRNVEEELDKLKQVAIKDHPEIAGELDG